MGESSSFDTMTGREKLIFPTLPSGADSRKVLLHCCCATCSGEVIEALLASGGDVTVFFYNPNIHPRDEYEKRKDDVKRFCSKLNVPFVDDDYEDAVWFDAIKGHEDAPERGSRCGLCFEMRLWRSAQYAAAQGFSVLATSLGISRWKDLDQVNCAGERAATASPPLLYWAANWRKQGGADRRMVIARREGFYQQDYCGCVFSAKAREEQKKRKKNEG